MPIPDDLVSAGPSPESETIRKDDADRAAQAVHTLAEPYKEVFELRVFGELSFRQIGMIFRKTESWARVTFHRARIKLKERLEENEISM